MKLSEAIREGAKLRPQYTDGDFFGMTEGGQVGTCALGAAIEAVTGIAPDEAEPRDIEEVYRYGFVYDTWPDLGTFGAITDVAIVDDNDCNGLTHEEIADKLEALGY